MEKLPTIYKIAFVGTLSSGKSTLWEKLRGLYSSEPSIIFVPEAARELFKQNPDIPEHVRHSFEIQERIQGMVLELEQRAHSCNPKVLICDRSVLDSCVYTRHFGNREGSWRLLERVNPWISTYSKLFLLNPKNAPFIQDAERREDEITRSKIHLEYLNFFADHNIPYELLSGSLEERITRVDQFLLQCYT